ncbi:MAG TPA: hypothetical protein VK203_06625 [Nostocaceae cyanobacterium]|nr:hypothetical protein [Nostocaceae cyanobacterium]
MKSALLPLIFDVYTAIDAYNTAFATLLNLAFVLEFTGFCLTFIGSTAPLMVNNINLIFVGWVERSETQQMSINVGFRPSTQPTSFCS